MNKDPILHDQLVELAQRVVAAKQNALQSANTVLLDLYWQIGEYISRKIADAEWTEDSIKKLALHFEQTQPGLRGFTLANLFRMRQFYETYKEHKKVAILVKLIPWAHNLIILNRSKSSEEREFYLRMALQEGWSSRELERQAESNLFERVVLLPRKIVPMMLYNHPGITAPLSDAYILEFLGIPTQRTKTNIRHTLINQLKSFFTELCSDFCFMGSEFPLQISEWDFLLDLLFFHRGLNALVAIELKLGEFEASHLGQLSFYLETLDNNIKKAHEQPSIGLLICTNQRNSLTKYTFNKSFTPEHIAECKALLPSRALLQVKLQEFYEKNNILEEENALA
jgi:predicted nuclease of restriction endonuclease-like (RecB) superfamily